MADQVKTPDNGAWSLFNALSGGGEPEWSRYVRAEAWPFYTVHLDDLDGSTETYESFGDDPIDGWMVSLYEASIDEYERVTECTTRGHAEAIASYFNFKIEESQR